jgi:heme-degrading monooxygenase HmoA
MPVFRLYAPLIAFAGLLAGCTIATPFRSAAPAAPGPDRVVLVLTHAVVEPVRRAAFDEHTRRVLESLPGQPGLLGYSVRRQVLGNEAWTMTVWRDEAARARFVASDVHRAAIAAGAPALRSVRFLRIEIAAAELPLSWSRALALLDEHNSEYATPR